MSEVTTGRRPRRRTGFVCTLLSGAALCALSIPDTRAAAAEDAGIQEITVTAQRRSENLHDVPIAIQAMTGDTLEQLNIENFDDLTKYTPNMTVGGVGPGQSNVYMRGLSVGGDLGGQGSAVGAFPNVAVYVDEQSAQIPGRNLDVYAADIQRIEVLEGPQGTLFGSGAQAGAVRYITNKPKLDAVEATVNAGTAGTVGGEASANVDAAINLPLIKDTAAVRLVIYDDRRGGYINNVPGTFVRQSTDAGIHYAGYTNNIPGPPTRINSANNSALVGKAINPVTYQGVRGEVYWKFNDDWNALITQSFQHMDAEGVFYETPNASGTGRQAVALPPLSVQLYNPSYDRDKFENTSLTVNGRIGELNLVYNAAYLVRDTTQVQDYTAYSRGVYTDYYQCIAPGHGSATAPAGCYSPSAYWREKEHDTHLTQEVRVSTPDDWRIRAIGGALWERLEVQSTTDFEYLTAPGFTPVGPPKGAIAYNPNVRDANDSFVNDITNGYTQLAGFASVDYDILPKVLTVTAGTRYYHFGNFEDGYSGGSFGCTAYGIYGTYTGPTPCTAGMSTIGHHAEYSGFKSRANLTWKITPEAMAYFTWSQGFRPGGFNRGSNSKTFSDGEHFKSPINFAPDTLTNYEIGYKTQWFNHRLEVDGAFYQEDWDNVQIRLFNPAELGLLSFTTNGPNYRVRGAETQITARPTQNLTLNLSGAVNQSNAVTSPSLTNTAGGTLRAAPMVFGPLDASLAQSPLFKGSARARYEWEIGDYLPFLQASVNHSSHTHSSEGAFNNFIEKPITSVDASAGVSRDNWSIQAYCDNLTNEHGAQFITHAEWVTAKFIDRPLTAGIRFSYYFGK